jgi:outer membrane protein assembly factor BamB
LLLEWFLSAGALFLPVAMAYGEEPRLDASSWPQFKRDAGRTGDHPQADLKFPLQRTTAVRFPAPIYASPAVVDGRVYIQDALGHVACIDSRKNQVLWTTDIGGFNNSSSPAVAGGKVFIGSTSGHFFILAADTGKVLKRIPADGGVLTAPALANGAVYFSTFDGKLFKIDLDGNGIWSFDGGRISTTEFCVRGQEILFFAGTSNTMFHHLRDLGKTVEVIGSTPAPGQCCPSGGPVFVDGTSFAFQSFDSEFGRYFLFSTQNPPGKSLATIGDVNDARIMSSVRGDRVYRGDKCFSMPGLKSVWRADPKILYDGGYHSSPALGQEVLTIGSERGSVWFFPLEGKTTVRQPVWEYKTVQAGQPNSAVSSSPALVPGQVFFGGEDGILYGLGQGTEVAIVNVNLPPDPPPGPNRLQGSEWPTPGGDMGYSYVSSDAQVKPPFQVQWKTRVWSTFKCPMIVADNRVYCGGRLGPMTALDAATGRILWKVHHPGVESRPAPVFAEGKLLVMRVRGNQGDSPYAVGASGGPAGEGLWCHEAATGKTLWHQPMSFRYHFNPDGLCVHEGKVFVIRLDGETGLEAVAYALENGKEVWRKSLSELGDPKAPPKTAGNVKPIPRGLRLPPRFSGVLAQGLWCVSISDRGTLALDPTSGKVAWSTSEIFISLRSRVASRNGILVVFTDEGDRALDAKTGQLLWKNTNKHAYAQGLSDLYLESQGKKDQQLSGGCWLPVLVNGVWYSHSRSSSNNRLVAMAGKVIWSFDFLSNSCPSPSPAYGRLYYSPNAEGVIYCFASAQK